MRVKRIMLSSALVLGLPVFGQAGSTSVFGNPAALGNSATAELATTFTLIRGSHGGFGGRGFGGRGMASGSLGGRGFAAPGPSSFAAIGSHGGRFGGRLAGRGFRHGRFVHGRFTHDRFRNRRFFAGTGFAGTG